MPRAEDVVAQIDSFHDEMLCSGVDAVIVGAFRRKWLARWNEHKRDWYDCYGRWPGVQSFICDREIKACRTEVDEFFMAKPLIMTDFL